MLHLFALQVDWTLLPYREIIYIQATENRQKKMAVWSCFCSFYSSIAQMEMSEALSNTAVRWTSPRLPRSFCPAVHGLLRPVLVSKGRLERTGLQQNNGLHLLHLHLSLNRGESLGHYRWLHNQFPPFFPVLHCPLGLGELQACPFSDAVFPPPFCLPCLLPPYIVPYKMVLARPDERETCPYHFSVRLFTIVRRFSCGPIACSILPRR